MTLELNSKNYYETATHIYFWGSIYSQWYSCKFQENKIMFNSAEQYMMYYKALTFNDQENLKKIMATSDPQLQKKLGRLVKGYDDTIWANKRFDVVVQGNYLKFGQNKKLKEELLSTGDKVLVEASPYDKIFGIGLGPTDERILDEKNWDGLNLLGKAIMKARELIKGVTK
jgi:ribA/ribD-fused uncharacterized protein